ncbi:4984_t:CDS:2, partial [Gigaspora margarita]
HVSIEALHIANNSENQINMRNIRYIDEINTVLAFYPQSYERLMECVINYNDKLFELPQLSSNINNQDVNDHLVEEQLFYGKVIEDYLDDIHKREEEPAKISQIYQASTSNESNKSDESNKNVKSNENDNSNKEN